MKASARILAARTLLALFLLLGLASAQPIDWIHLSTETGELPDAPGGQQQTGALIADLDHDGLNDYIIAERSESPSVVAYMRHADGWDRVIVDNSPRAIEAGGATYDIDGDGDLDIVFGQDDSGSQIWWWENPSPNIGSASWTRRTIKNSFGSLHYEHTFGDFDNDGFDELATWINSEDTIRIYDIPANPRSTSPWPTYVDVAISESSEGEAMDAADVNVDGKTDLVFAGYWIPNSEGGAYNPIPFDANFTSGHVIAADFIPGGWLELVQGPSTEVGVLKFYRWNGNVWVSSILRDDVFRVHSIEAGDFNRDGKLDFFAGEMGTPGSGPNAETWIVWGDNLGNFSFETIAVGLGNHNSRAGDLNGDGYLDLLIKPFRWGTPRIDVFLAAPTPLPLAQWEKHVLENDAPWTPLFVDGGDLNGDGRADLIAGGWWYENPGDLSAPWTRRDLGSPLDNMLVVRDFDADGDLDVLGTSGQDPAARSGFDAFYVATNDGQGNFTVFANGVSPSGTDSFPRGVAAGVLSPGAPQNVFLSWDGGGSPGPGTELLTVPGFDPITLSAISEGAGLSLGDLDGDSDLDVFQGTGWLRNNSPGWFRFDAMNHFGTSSLPDQNRLADMDNDGDLDAVVTFSGPVGVMTTVLWLENSLNPSELWNEHIITTGVSAGWSLEVADFDNDGDTDVVVGEHEGMTRLQLFENLGDGDNFSLQMIDLGGTEIDHGELRVVDIDDDLDLDVLSVGRLNDKVWIFENRAIDLGDPLTPPAPPTGLEGFVLGDSFILLEWDENTEVDFRSYTIYRTAGKQASVDPVNRWRDEVRESRLHDDQADELTTYSYVVTATDSFGNESDPSSPVMLTTPGDDAPPTLSAVTPRGATVLDVRFSEPVTVATAENPTHYTLFEGSSSRDVLDAILLEDDQTVRITTEVLDDQDLHRLQVNGIQDTSISGNVGSDEILFVSDSNILGRWGFNEGAGEVAFDSSGNGNDGSVEGPRWVAGSTAVGDGSAYSLAFDGVDDYVDVSGLNVTGNKLTIACWLRADSFAVADARIVSRADGLSLNDHYFMLGTVVEGTGVKLRFRVRTGSTTTTLVATDELLLTGTWIHVAAVYNGSSMRLYKDGVLLGTRSKSGSLSNAGGAGTAIGNQPPGAGNRPFEGRIDDVIIVRRALTHTQIQALARSSNRPPHAVADDYQTEPNEILVVSSSDGLLTNDLDPEGDSLTASLFSGTAGGNLSVNPDGSFSYQPASGFVGIETFEYQAHDGLLESGLATVTLRVSSMVDCNLNGQPDSLDLLAGTSLDCNGNAIPDECEDMADDCNANGVPDECDLLDGSSLDCNGNSVPDECDAFFSDCNENGVPDSCDIDSGTSFDCNGNGAPDECDIASGMSSDCDANGVPDPCDVMPGSSHDCNHNGVPDPCDIEAGISFDENNNGLPDECDQDCNENGIGDPTDLQSGFSQDCNQNGVPDECDLVALYDVDCDGNGIPDTCDIEFEGAPDCNDNGILDLCEFATGMALDCNENQIPDECDLRDGTSLDCNQNNVPDSCDLAAGTSSDCNANGIPDECDDDCNGNGTPDDCETFEDCNNNGLADECELAVRTEADCNDNGVLDECDVANGTSDDCNNNGIPDACDLASGTSTDDDANGMLDDCEQLVGNWRFDEGTGSTAGDSSPNGNNASISGAQWTTETNDQSAAALRFDGINDRVNLGALEVPGDRLTLTARFRADDFGVPDSRILSKATGVNANDHYWMVSTIAVGRATRLRLRLRTDGNTQTLIASSGDLSPQVWYHAAAVYDGTTVRLYLDGTLVGSGLQRGSIDSAPTVLASIGGQPFGAGFRPFDGIIDDVRIYSRALGANEVSQLANTMFMDCNGNGALDDTDLANGDSVDCNNNGIPDECDLSELVSLDCNLNGIPDECEVDCDANGIPDECDLAADESLDCNDNGIPDSCDLLTGETLDCNGNKVPDECDLASGLSVDCNGNGVPDDCDLAMLFAVDCNSNGIPDSCDLTNGASDCNGNGIPDACDLVSGQASDCNANGVLDSCDIASGVAKDCNDNAIPDSCDFVSGVASDCNLNGFPDACDIEDGVSLDCNANFIPDECDLSLALAYDCNTNGVPDSCEVASGLAFDCDANGVLDQCDIASGTSLDCNANGIPDPCDLASAPGLDCNTNGVLDECDIANGVSLDCNANGIPDNCDITDGTVGDCDGNGVPDSCDLAGGRGSDCNLNGILDACEFAAGDGADCNSNGVLDECDIASGIAMDCNSNLIPDSCDFASGVSVDCNGNGIPDSCDLNDGAALDCNGNSVPDSCDIAGGLSLDCNGNGVPDSCDLATGIESDCDGNTIPDSCDLASGAPDCDGNGTLDECDIVDGMAADCDTNGVPDACDLSDGTYLDCNANGVPDACDIASGLSLDCNSNGVPDSCDIAVFTSSDCNGNGVPDGCEIAFGMAEDCNNNGTLDECDLALGIALDCNDNAIPDSCDIDSGTSLDLNLNSLPDECELDCNGNGVPDAVDLTKGTSEDCNSNGIPDECDIAAATSVDGDNNGVPDECSNDLLARWSFEEGMGVTTSDVTGNGHVGQLDGPHWVPESADGSSYSLRFDGSLDVITLAPMDLSGSAMTISTWIRAHDFGRPDARIVSKATSNTESGHFWMLSTVATGGQIRTRFRLKTDGDTSTLVANGGALTTGVWTHVAATYDGTSMRLYVNGDEVGSIAKRGMITQNPNVPVAIGNQPPGISLKTFDGLIDDVRIYNRALSPAELTDLATP